MALMSASSAPGLMSRRTMYCSRSAQVAPQMPQFNARCACIPQPILKAPRSRQLTLVARADSRNGDSGFTTGFILGGVVFGTLGFLFAPQISKALLGDDQRLRLPRFLEDDSAKDPETTKQDLIEKIAQLNASIDEVAAKLEKTDKVEVAA